MIKLAIRLFNPQEKSHIEILVKQAMKRMGQTFTLSNIAEADAVFLSPNDPGFDTLFGAQDKRNLTPIVYDDTNQSGYDLFLKKPATSSDLLQLIDKLVSHKNIKTPVIENNNNSQSPGSISDHVIDHTLMAEKNNEVITLRNLHTKPVYIDGFNHKVSIQYGDMHGLSLSRNLARLLNSETPLIIERCSHKAMMQNMENTNYGLHDLDLFIWTCALNSSARFRDVQSRYRLKSWPDFARLPYTNDHLKLTALLAKKALPLKEIVSTTGININIIRGFLFACESMQLIDCQREENANTIQAQRQNISSSIIKKVMNRFFGTQAA